MHRGKTRPQQRAEGPGPLPPPPSPPAGGLRILPEPFERRPRLLGAWPRPEWQPRPRHGLPGPFPLPFPVPFPPRQDPHARARERATPGAATHSPAPPPPGPAHQPREKGVDNKALPGAAPPRPGPFYPISAQGAVSGVWIPASGLAESVFCPRETARSFLHPPQISRLRNGVSRDFRKLFWPVYYAKFQELSERQRGRILQYWRSPGKNRKIMAVTQF